eukprot:569146-Pyramimonas_sp.AAC.1
MQPRGCRTHGPHDALLLRETTMKLSIEVSQDQKWAMRRYTRKENTEVGVESPPVLEEFAAVRGT